MRYIYLNVSSRDYNVFKLKKDKINLANYVARLIYYAEGNINNYIK